MGLLLFCLRFADVLPLVFDEHLVIVPIKDAYGFLISVDEEDAVFLDRIIPLIVNLVKNS